MKLPMSNVPIVREQGYLTHTGMIMGAFLTVRLFDCSTKF